MERKPKKNHNLNIQRGQTFSRLYKGGTDFLDANQWIDYKELMAYDKDVNLIEMVVKGSMQAKQTWKLFSWFWQKWQIVDLLDQALTFH